VTHLHYTNYPVRIMINGKTIAARNPLLPHLQCHICSAKKRSEHMSWFYNHEQGNTADLQEAHQFIRQKVYAPT